MTEIQFDKKTVFKLNLYGESYELKKPTVLQTLNFQKKLNSLKEDLEKFEALIDFFQGLGLKRDAIDSMEMDQLVELSQVVSGSSKKK